MVVFAQSSLSFPVRYLRTVTVALRGQSTSHCAKLEGEGYLIFKGLYGNNSERFGVDGGFCAGAGLARTINCNRIAVDCGGLLVNQVFILKQGRKLRT